MPLEPPQRGAVDLGNSRKGNRFDSYAGGFSVLYFGTTQHACFGETLARFRPDPRLAFIDQEWHNLGFMNRGHVPRDWRTRRLAVRARLPEDAAFLDIYDVDSAQWLRDQLLPSISVWGHDDLDVALLQGPDRRVTRLVSDYVWNQEDEDGMPVFDGIRYTSRLNPAWECWAVFDDVELEETERHPILPTLQPLLDVADAFGLQVFQRRAPPHGGDAISSHT